MMIELLALEYDNKLLVTWQLNSLNHFDLT